MRSPLRAPAVVLLAVALFLSSGCQQIAPQPTPTPEPTATLAPTPTKLPTATATPRPTSTPRPTATAVRAAPALSLPPGSVSGASPSMDELGDFAADLMPTMMALLPTAPPVPEGESVALSRQELEGVWEGWITIDSLTISGMPAEEQQMCEEQLEMIKGRQLPTEMEFVPDSEETGTVTVIDEQGISREDGEKPIPYRYSDGLMVMEAQEDEVTSRFEGRTLQTSRGTVMVGTWASMGKMDESELGIPAGGSELPEVSIKGRWSLTRTGEVLR